MPDVIMEKDETNNKQTLITYEQAEYVCSWLVVGVVIAMLTSITLVTYFAEQSSIAQSCRYLGCDPKKEEIFAIKFMFFVSILVMTCMYYKFKHSGCVLLKSCLETYWWWIKENKKQTDEIDETKKVFEAFMQGKEIIQKKDIPLNEKCSAIINRIPNITEKEMTRIKYVLETRNRPMEYTIEYLKKRKIVDAFQEDRIRIGIVYDLLFHK